MTVALNAARNNSSPGPSAPDPLAFVGQALAHGDDPWEAITDAGIAAREHMDRGRWLIGDLAILVKKQYKQDRLGDFASVLALEPARVREYRRVSRFWEKSHRRHFLDFPQLSYSHFREAMRLGDVAQAAAFLDECATETLPVEVARARLNERLGKQKRPKPLTFEAEARAGSGGVYFELAEGVYLSVNTTRLFVPGAEYHFSIREVTAS